MRATAESHPDALCKRLRVEADAGVVDCRRSRVRKRTGQPWHLEPDWLVRADAFIRKLTPEGRIRARIAVLRAHLDRPDLDVESARAHNERLSKLEAKRALLQGPLDARTHRQHTKKPAQDLESLWTEVFTSI